MVSRGDDKYVIYPFYFDQSLSRQEGRRVPKSLAKEKPNLEDIAKSAQSLGFRPKLERNHAHPFRPWKTDGRILIEKKGKKTHQIKQIASRL